MNLHWNVEVRGVSLAFKSRHGTAVTVLKDFSLTVAPGEKVAIRGRSGSGKSTILAIIGAMLKPQKGQTLLGGNDIYEMSDAQRSRLRAREVGFLFQNDFLLPRYTVYENVRLAATYAGQQYPHSAINALLQQVGLLERSDHFPEELSGGERHRAALARAIINRPRILLADEPTGNLDRQSAEQILSVMFQSSSSAASIIVATHDDWLASKMDRSISIDHF